MQIRKSEFCETSSSKTVTLCNLSLAILWCFSSIQHDAVMILHLNKEEGVLTFSHSSPQRPRSFWFLVLTKRIAASGDDNDVNCLFLSCTQSSFWYFGTKWQEDREYLSSSRFKSTKIILAWSASTTSLGGLPYLKTVGCSGLESRQLGGVLPVMFF